jgi:hypothetical protein
LSALVLSLAVAPALSQSPQAEPIRVAHQARIAEPHDVRAFGSKLSPIALLNGPTHRVRGGDTRVASAIGPFDLRKLSLVDFGDVEP